MQDRGIEAGSSYCEYGRREYGRPRCFDGIDNFLLNLSKRAAVSTGRKRIKAPRTDGSRAGAPLDLEWHGTDVDVSFFLNYRVSYGFLDIIP